jgi:hypothetical protein
MNKMMKANIPKQNANEQSACLKLQFTIIDKFFLFPTPNLNFFL